MTMHIFIQNVDSKDVQFTCPPYTAGPTLLPRPWTRFRTFLEGIPGLPVQLLSGTCGAQDTGGQARPGRSLRSAATQEPLRRPQAGLSHSLPPQGPRAAAMLGHRTPFRAIPCRAMSRHSLSLRTAGRREGGARGGGSGGPAGRR